MREKTYYQCFVFLFFLRFSVPVKFRSRQVYELLCVRATHQLWTVQSGY